VRPTVFVSSENFNLKSSERLGRVPLPRSQIQINGRKDKFVGGGRNNPITDIVSRPVAVGYRILLFLPAPRPGCSFYLAAGFLVVRARYPHAPQLQESSGSVPPIFWNKIFLVPSFCSPFIRFVSLRPRNCFHFLNSFNSFKVTARKQLAQLEHGATGLSLNFNSFEMTCSVQVFRKLHNVLTQ
jgi:hypothetical protein